MAVPQFNVATFSAPDRYIGAGSAQMPCVPGDQITLTASIQYISGPMQPMITVVFIDVSQTVILGFIQISPPNTDNGWHNYSFTVFAPPGAAFLAVQTQCEYLAPASGLQISATTQSNIVTGPNTVLVDNTNNIETGITVTVTNRTGGHPPPAVRFESVAVDAVNPGVSFNATFVDSFVIGSKVSGSLPAGLCYFVGYVPLGFNPPSTGAGQTQWAISNYRLTQNGNPVYAPLTGFSLTLTSVVQSTAFIFPLYYLSLFTSEYQSAPKLYAWASTLLAPIVDLIACTQQLYQAFQLSTAVGPQLDIIGGIVGAPRLLPLSTGVTSALTTSAITVPGQQSVSVNNTNYLFVGETVTVGAESVEVNGLVPGSSFAADFASTHITGTAVTGTGPAPSPLLDDNDYRILIQAQIAKNQWDGQVDQIYDLWNAIFPYGRMTFIDNQNMTVNIILAGSFTQVQQLMLLGDLLLPRPQGVLYIYEFAQLPLFGFDEDNAVIAGFDDGFFA